MFEINFVGIFGCGRVGVFLVKRAVRHKDFVLAVLGDAELDGEVFFEGGIHAETVND